jgi:hypothetical protein
MPPVSIEKRTAHTTVGRWRKAGYSYNYVGGYECGIFGQGLSQIHTISYIREFLKRKRSLQKQMLHPPYHSRTFWPRDIDAP